LNRPVGERRDLREAALRAAIEGGRAIREARSITREVSSKGAGDYVTDVDRDAERAVATLLETVTPDIPVHGEEHGGVRGDRYWLVDPLDGTTNFLHGFPVVGVSVALIEEGRPTAGAVHAPFLDMTFTAAREEGAEQDGRTLRVSEADPTSAVVATGFPFRHKDRLVEYKRVFDPALERFEDIRRPGAASLDLAWVAAGVFDGFFELGLSPWDVAAGALLIEEAGGTVSDWTGGPDYLSGDILAGAPRIHAALVDLATASVQPSPEA
jgi:myo-inositol-1(or 4)-monophosphatase